MSNYCSANSNLADIVQISGMNDNACSKLADRLPGSDEKWAAWQTLSFILLTCGSFWIGVFYVIKMLTS